MGKDYDSRAYQLEVRRDKLFTGEPQRNDLESQTTTINSVDKDISVATSSALVDETIQQHLNVVNVMTGILALGSSIDKVLKKFESDHKSFFANKRKAKQVFIESIDKLDTDFSILKTVIHQLFKNYLMIGESFKTSVLESNNQAHEGKPQFFEQNIERRIQKIRESQVSYNQAETITKEDLIVLFRILGPTIRQFIMLREMYKKLLEVQEKHRLQSLNTEWINKLNFELLRIIQISNELKRMIGIQIEEID